MIQTTLEIIKAYISKNHDFAQEIFEKRNDTHQYIEINTELKGCQLYGLIEFTLDVEYYTEFSADNLTPPEEHVRDWSFNLDNQEFWFNDEDITEQLALKESELYNDLAKKMRY